MQEVGAELQPGARGGVAGKGTAGTERPGPGTGSPRMQGLSLYMKLAPIGSKRAGAQHACHDGTSSGSVPS